MAGMGELSLALKIKGQQSQKQRWQAACSRPPLLLALLGFSLPILIPYLT
jgi:hypothetical protein